VKPGTEPLNVKLLPDQHPLARFLPRAVGGFVILGLLGRLARYLLNFPLWPDESFLAAGFIDGTFAGTLGALDYHQVAPLLFVWTELIFVKIFGFSEYSLRLFPFLSSVAGVFLFLHLARRLLKGFPLLLAVAIFTVSYYPIRHGCEVKPYGVDLTVSLVLLVLAVEWRRDSNRGRFLWLLALAVIPAVGLSFPAVFIAGGISLGLLGPVIRQRRAAAAGPYLAFNLALLGAFLAVYFISTGPQYETESWLSGPQPELGRLQGKYSEGAWDKTFPPLGDPPKLLVWLIDTHTGRLFAYPNGGKNGGSVLTFVCFAVGAACLFRRGRRDLLAILLSPFVLALVAAGLRRYPYGYSARFNLYLAPIICLLAGVGAARLIAAIRPVRTRLLVLAGFISLLALFGAGTIAGDLIRPYKNEEDRRSRNFARWFWAAQGRDAEIACVYTDLGEEFFPGLFEWGNSARYLCHQRIYSPFHRRGRRRPDLEAVSPSRPLRCVVFSVPENLFPYARRDEEKWNRWRTEMESRYELADYAGYEVNSGVDGQHETYQTFDFVPRD